MKTSRLLLIYQKKKTTKKYFETYFALFSVASLLLIYQKKKTTKKVYSIDKLYSWCINLFEN